MAYAFTRVDESCMSRNILVLGAAGMLGRKLVARLLDDARVTGLTLHDIVAPDRPGTTLPVTTIGGDVSEAGLAERLVAERPEIIFHLAAVVSAEAEADFAKGYRVNLDGTRHLLEAIRALPGYRPRVVFTSSLAVFGTPLPDVIPDDHILTPLSSYGIQKAIGELLIQDYTRKGFIDGIGIRLPTICVRPGKPNKAASGFFSGIIREPLHGQEAILPVAPSLRHWFASPTKAVEYLLHAADLDGAALGPHRNLTMPGVSATVAEQIEALRDVAGDAAVKLIRHVPDPAIQAIVETWPRAFDTARASALGFRADDSFAAIIRLYQQEEMR
jgi:nucleoside-diphosphate-sugar epimerase